jgi:PTH1 family peptidyl-tRNA hydrolase
VKVICGLGNPGAEYEDTRHNAGWWAIDRLASEWRFPALKRDGNARTCSGRVGAESVQLIKPLTYVNRSGGVLGRFRGRDNFDLSRDLLVIVDEVALEPGRLRLRPRGSAGGHNGLKSIQTVLGTQEYARLRIGVGACPPGADLADWVLSPLPPEDRKTIIDVLPDVVEMTRVWLEEGAESAMRLNR